MIHFDIVPRNLSNMEHEFHYKFVNIDLCFKFEPYCFLGCRTLIYRIGRATFNMPLAINTNNFLHFQSTSKEQRLQIIKTRRWLLHAYILDNIGFNNRNGYTWMKEIHMVKMMGIIVYPRRTINMSLGKPKNLFTFEVWKAIYEG